MRDALIRQGGSEAVLAAGDFVMWDSDRDMEFRVLDPLHKLTLLIPKHRMKALLGDAERYAGLVVPGSGRAEGIAAEALRRVARESSCASCSRLNVMRFSARSRSRAVWPSMFCVWRSSASSSYVRALKRSCSASNSCTERDSRSYSQL